MKGHALPKKIEQTVAINMMLEANLKPIEPYVNMQTPWRSICLNCNSEVSPKLVAIKTHKGGCWNCGVAKRTRSRTKIPLTQSHPEIASQAYAWDSSTLTAGSNKIMAWQCQEGHIYNMKVQSRLVSGKCPVCIGRILKAGYNDLKTTFPDVASSACGWDPETVTGGSSEVRKWQCPEGHVYESRVQERTRSDKTTGCPVCTGKIILIGYNDLKTRFPDIAREADGWNPQSFTYRSNKKMPWKCSEGHKWKAIIGNRTTGHHCPSCATSGFDPSLQGYLYLVKQEAWGMLQIGITNFPDKRLAKHRKLGWELVELRGPIDGYLTKESETAILKMLKEKGADLSNSEIAGKFDGYSEAWSKATFEVESIKKLLQLAEE